jgi:hypothetical protein
VQRERRRQSADPTAHDQDLHGWFPLGATARRLCVK